MARATLRTSLDYRRPHRPLLVAAANRAGRIADRMGFWPADLSETLLMEAARRKAGLHDFGEEDFIERLSVLLWSIENEARLHPLGRMAVKQSLVRILVNRLRMEDALGRHPEILDKELAPPVVIAGLQRTGTTVIHRLMALDSRFRFLPSWEAVNPAPFPGHDGTGADPRIRAAETAQRVLSYAAPDFFAVHPIEARGPEEDCLLFDFGFWSTVPEATMRIPTFSEWLEQQDHVQAYRYFERVLKYLQWVRPGGRWLLKSPQHMEHLDALFEIFPSARVIQTHRDPVRVMASFCSMVCHGRGLFSDEVDPLEVGRQWSLKARKMVRKVMAVRQGGYEDRFIDVSYGNIVRDPVGEVRRIYDFVNMAPEGQVERSMRAWLSENPQHKHGVHRYRLESFGLDADTLEREFAGYVNRFGIPREPPGRARGGEDA